MEFRKDIIEVVNFLVTNKIKFAIYRIPNTDETSLFIEFGNLCFNTFVIQAFDNADESLSISGDLILKNEEIKMSNIDFSIIEFYQENTVKDSKTIFFTQVEYENYVADTVLQCRTENFEKGVCARVKNIEKPADFNIGEYFMKLVDNYSSAFVNLYYHQDCGLWIGATPELLIKQTSENSYETVSLAGTKLKSKNRDWTEKEIDEQQIVTDYIVNSLKQNQCDVLNNTEAKTVDAGEIQHLKSKIEFQTKLDTKSISKILHPTPAVCGMPKEKAFNLIKKYEGNQRQNYTGFIGLISEKNTALYVNLRCMQILEKEFLVYVGAGITNDSIPEKEWQETENKAQTLLRFL